MDVIVERVGALDVHTRDRRHPNCPHPGTLSRVRPAGHVIETSSGAAIKPARAGAGASSAASAVPSVILRAMSSPPASGTPKLGVLLAMAMFVFVIDTSLMNVSISAVVRDLDTTASAGQWAGGLGGLVSAAFILIGSKIGDLFGRKRAYITGLVFYASG